MNINKDALYVVGATSNCTWFYTNLLLGDAKFQSFIQLKGPKCLAIATPKYSILQLKDCDMTKAT